SSYPRRNDWSLPLWTCADLSDLLNQAPCYQTALDSRALFGWEQAKSVRRGSTKFTCHAQLFHKHGNCASRKKIANFARENHSLRAEKNVIALFRCKAT